MKFIGKPEANGDITSVTAGTNLAGGGTSGDVTINLASATTSTLGAASFDNNHFAVDSGAVSIKTGALRIDNLRSDAVTTSSESFADNDDTLMTSASILDLSQATYYLTPYRFMGYAIGDGTNFEAGQGMTDGQAPFEHNTSHGTNGLDAISPSTLFRMGGWVMSRAGTIKNLTGWATGSGASATVYIQFMKWTPVRNVGDDVTPVLIKQFTFTALGNTKVEDFDSSTMTDSSVAEGDILFTQLKTSASGVTVYFNFTMEVLH